MTCSDIMESLSSTFSSGFCFISSQYPKEPLFYPYNPLASLNTPLIVPVVKLLSKDGKGKEFVKVSN